jgi:uncharacterized protein (DUF427 family)
MDRRHRDTARDHALGWHYFGQRRPPFAVEPLPGQESVWDYPRPPRLELDAREVVVSLAGVEVARTRSAQRVLETASPPTFYIPRADVIDRYLQPAPGGSHCEWKGSARYWTVAVPSVGSSAVPLVGAEAAAWSYEHPTPEFTPIRGHVSFYPGRLECYVDGVRVLPQPGRFYGAWVTPDVVGPFKGEPGSSGW